MDWKTRRVAAHEVVLPDGSVLTLAVVELVEGRVVNYYTFSQELPLTEWMGGTIQVVEEDGQLIAYWHHQRL